MATDKSVELWLQDCSKSCCDESEKGFAWYKKHDQTGFLKVDWLVKMTDY